MAFICFEGVWFDYLSVDLWKAGFYKAKKATSSGTSLDLKVG